MNLVNVKFLSLSLILFANISFADFTQNQVRYIGYFDTLNTIKNLDVYNDECITATRKNSVVFGYSSPVNGKPISSSPNFDYVSSFINCLNQAQFDNLIYRMVTSETQTKIGDLGYNIDQVNESILKLALDEITLSIIGPEIVLISYGHISSQKDFRELIHNSSLNIVNKSGDQTVRNYLKQAIILIYLRDEALSY